MDISVTKETTVLELPRWEFGMLEPQAIKQGVLGELRRLAAVRQYAQGKISKRELMAAVGIEAGQEVIEAREITATSIERVIRDYQTRR